MSQNKLPKVWNIMITVIKDDIQNYFLLSCFVRHPVWHKNMLSKEKSKSKIRLHCYKPYIYIPIILFIISN